MARREQLQQREAEREKEEVVVARQSETEPETPSEMSHKQPEAPSEMSHKQPEAPPEMSHQQPEAPAKYPTSSQAPPEMSHQQPEAPPEMSHQQLETPRSHSAVHYDGATFSLRDQLSALARYVPSTVLKPPTNKRYAVEPLGRHSSEHIACERFIESLWPDCEGFRLAASPRYTMAHAHPTRSCFLVASVHNREQTLQK